MELVLQDPHDQESLYLDEEILLACSGATRGVGVFAFASRDGVNALLDNPKFAAFIEHASFELIVGMGAVTDTKTIERLSEIAQKYETLSVRVFLSAKHESLFHPKFCWFIEPEGLRLILGSGNLTMGGLRKNWEAFTSSTGDVESAVSIDDKWADWSLRNAGRLVELNDPRVVARAAFNARSTAAMRTLRKQLFAELHVPEVGEDGPGAAPAQPENLDPDVLIAEIPRSGDRWKQVNFNRETFEDYFGAKIGKPHRIFLTQVNPDGSKEEAEFRPSVSVVSQNYRFELNAAAGVEYPDAGRPLGLFLRTAKRQFLYMLLMPGEVAYEKVSQLLNVVAGPQNAKMRRPRVSRKQLSTVWHDCPLLKLENEEELIET